MFLSIRKHPDGSSPALLKALHELCLSLLSGMRLHVIRGEEREILRFQSSILGLEQKLTDVPPARIVASIAADAALTYESYCRYTNGFLEVQGAELAAMVSMLTATVTSIAGTSQIAVERLSGVEKRLERAGFCTDLIKLRAELGECLALVREESYRQREHNASTIHTLQRGVSDTQQRIAGTTKSDRWRRAEPLMKDHATGLPGRADAEDALFHARDREGMYAAVLPVDRLALINSRFGSEATDIVMQFFAKYVAEHLHTDDQLFRWKSNALLALVERPQAPDAVRADLSRFASAPLELPVPHHGRELLLPVTSTWALFPASEGRTYDALIAKIAIFLQSEMHRKDSF